MSIDFDKPELNIIHFKMDKLEAEIKDIDKQIEDLKAKRNVLEASIIILGEVSDEIIGLSHTEKTIQEGLDIPLNGADDREQAVALEPLKQDNQELRDGSYEWAIEMLCCGKSVSRKSWLKDDVIQPKIGLILNLPQRDRDANDWFIVN